MAEKETLRLFVAVLLPSDIVANLREAQDRFKKLLPGGPIRWAKPEQIHVTLRFFGRTERAVLPELQRALAQAASQAPGPIALQIRDWGVFPSLKRPRVFWAGVCPPDALASLAASINALTANFGEPPEDREFKPHLTLARIPESTPALSKQLGEVLHRPEIRTDLSFSVKEIHLVESRLSPQGAQYTALAAFTLGTAV